MEIFYLSLVLPGVMICMAISAKFRLFSPFVVPACDKRSDMKMFPIDLHIK
jgi:hypothetical protein